MSTHPATTTPRIAIIGAGPAGLVLLNVLARHGVTATLYERDDQFGSRAHLGGTLDLHFESGQAAMKGAGLWDVFVAHSRPEGQEMTFTDRSGEPLFHVDPPTDAEHLSLILARPEIDRTVLRKIMVDAAPPSSIKWGYTLTCATPVAGSSEWELTFAHGEKVTVDLLIGADGGRSRVRPLVSDAEAAYTGVPGVEVSFDSSAQPGLSERVGNGSVIAVDEHKAIIAQRNGDGRIRTYAFFLHDDAEYVPSLVGDPERAIAEALSRYEGWAPWLRQLVEVADRHAVYPRPLFMLPVGHSWTHRAGVTLVGDAMNLMTPFAGKGVNIAMLAAMKLGEALASVAGRPMEEVDAKVTDCEKEIIALAAQDAAKTDRNMRKMIFAEHGAHEMVAGFKASMARVQ